MLQLQSPSFPGSYSTKIWMSTELAENQDFRPLGYPHHRGVLGFWRIFYTNLKIDIGLRDAGPDRSVYQEQGEMSCNHIASF